MHWAPQILHVFSTGGECVNGLSPPGLSNICRKSGEFDMRTRVCAENLSLCCACLKGKLPILMSQIGILWCPDPVNTPISKMKETVSENNVFHVYLYFFVLSDPQTWRRRGTVYDLYCSLPPVGNPDVLARCPDVPGLWLKFRNPTSCLCKVTLDKLILTDSFLYSHNKFLIRLLVVFVFS